MKLNFEWKGRRKKWISVWIFMNNIVEGTAVLSMVWERKREKNYDKVIIEILEKEMQEKISVNDIGKSNRLWKKQTGSRLWPITVIISCSLKCNF